MPSLRFQWLTVCHLHTWHYMPHCHFVGICVEYCEAFCHNKPRSFFAWSPPYSTPPMIWNFYGHHRRHHDKFRLDQGSGNWSNRTSFVCNGRVRRGAGKQEETGAAQWSDQRPGWQKHNATAGTLLRNSLWNRCCYSEENLVNGAITTLLSSPLLLTSCRKRFKNRRNCYWRVSHNIVTLINCSVLPEY